MGLSPRSTCTAPSPINGNARPKAIKIYSSHLANQPTLSQTFDRITKFKPCDYRAQKIITLITEIICIDIQTLSVVENTGFKRLINHLEPRIIKQIRMKCMQSSQNVFQMKFQLYIIEVIPFHEVSHTADDIGHFISDILLQWGLTTKVAAIVRDGGTDITKAINDSAFVPVPCSAQLFQCMVRKAFLDNLFFKHSNKNIKILKWCQNQFALPQHRMIQDVSTRWNNTLHMMKRLNEQKNAIIMASSRKDATISAELTVDEWKKLEHLIDIIITFFLQVIPLMQVMQHHLKIPSPKGTGLQGHFIHTNELIAKATVLDPRFKLNPFQQEKHSIFLSSVKNSIVSEMEKISVTHGLSPAEKDFGDTIFNHVTPDSHRQLKNVALKYRCVPLSTVSNERAFSTAGAIGDVKRNRHDYKREKMLIFCHKHLQRA
ncbi:hypothetical protein PR048_002085, partial [Dryococelus australis]